jgi:hypothetical protein
MGRHTSNKHRLCIVNISFLYISWISGKLGLVDWTNDETRHKMHAAVGDGYPSHSVHYK